MKRLSGEDGKFSDDGGVAVSPQSGEKIAGSGVAGASRSQGSSKPVESAVVSVGSVENRKGKRSSVVSGVGFYHVLVLNSSWGRVVFTLISMA